MSRVAWIPFDIAVVLAFMLVGAWLEDTDGKYGFFDELLTPLPCGMAALGLIFLERF